MGGERYGHYSVLISHSSYVYSMQRIIVLFIFEIARKFEHQLGMIKEFLLVEYLLYFQMKGYLGSALNKSRWRGWQFR